MKPKDEVKLTVLMPAYNAGLYIAEAITSVLVQTFHDFELLIINDGSTDNTVDVIKSFQDERIVLINQENKGVAAALNKGLTHARAELIARFDADDRCFPFRLEQQYNFMVANPDHVIVGSAAEYMDAAGNYIFTQYPAATSDTEIKDLPFDVCPFIHASVCYKKSVVQCVGYNEYAHSFEDHLLWQQLKFVGQVHNMSEPLLCVRLNPGSLTMDERKRPREFHTIKHRVLQSGTITVSEADQLLELIRAQDNPVTKEGAYYSLLAKKFLWNNYNPVKARSHVRKAILLNAFDVKDYLIWLMSFLPKQWINNLYTFFISSK